MSAAGSEPSFDCCVIGGGPAGSAVAAIVARAGLRVLLLEAARHPRPHVGESLLPGIVPVLDEMGALAAVEAAGFTRKSGATHWDWGLTPSWDLWFADTEAYDHAWLVERARFDEILFRAAARAGAQTIEDAAVREVLFDGERAVGVLYRRRGAAEPERALARFVVDCSGQAGLLARARATRTPIPGLQHHAAFAHFDGGGRLPPPRRDQALLVAERSRWLWYFPLDERLTSVGAVFLEEHADDASRERALESAIAGSKLAALLGEARRVSPVWGVRDWSYRVDPIAGPGWLAAGDSSGFIDPVLSTGVLLALHAASRAARAIVAVCRGADEAVERAGYRAAHQRLFDDLLRIVRFFYQRNLHVDDYFWESKRILSRTETDLKPQRAFLALTSGLVHNLTLDERVRATDARREARATAGRGDAPQPEQPERLGFVCFHLRDARRGDLYLLLEPVDPAAPAMFRTRNLDVNCLAPRLGNDPLSDGELAPPLRRLAARLASLDDRPGEPLASFWRRARGAIAEAVAELSIAIVRVFGE